MSKVRSDIDVHPKHHLLDTLTKQDFDVAVLGGGPTGLTCAIRLAKSGLSVLVVERELLGGECQNWACVPSKALLRPIEVNTDARAVGGARELLMQADKSDHKGIGGLDLEGQWGFRDRATFNWNDEGAHGLLESLGVVFITGSASIPAPQKVKIEDWHSRETVEVNAKSIVIATGSEPRIPQISGIEDVKYWTPREAVSSREVPEHLVILGGGPVGTEFAVIYARQGSKVTLVTRGKQILPSVHPEAIRRVAKSMTSIGIEIINSAEATSVSQSNNTLNVNLSTNKSLTSTHLLVASGRSTRTVGMNLTQFNIPEGKIIPVDAHMRASAVPEGWLYALADTNGISSTTHMGMYEANITAQHIIGKNGKGKIVPGTDTTLPHLRRTIPQTVFTDPQVSFVGLSLAKAREAGYNDVREISVDTGAPGTHSYLYAEEYSGWASWVVEGSSGKILGAVFVGKGASNLLHASTVAVTCGLGWREVMHAVPSFPTLSEVYHLLVGACLSEEWEGLK